MAFTFYPPVDPSPGTRKSQDVSLYKAEFGDGYSQAVPKGLNHIRRKLSIIWEALTPAQCDEIVAFITDRQGYEAFFYTPPGEIEPLLWTCEQWDHGTSAGVYTISAEFVQSFAIV